MVELELTSWRLLQLWWALFWRWAAVYLIIAGIVLLATFAGYAVMKIAHLSEDFITHVIGRPLFVAWLLAAPLAGVMAIRLAIASRKGQFRIALLPTDGPRETEASLEIG